MSARHRAEPGQLDADTRRNVEWWSVLALGVVVAVLVAAFA